MFLRIANGKKIYLNTKNNREFWVGNNNRRYYCGHGKFSYTCGDCGGAGYCQEHKVRKTRCIECKGKTRCEAHGKLKRYCKVCNGGKKQYCVAHGKEMRFCRDCGGGWSLCKHDYRRHLCMFCSPDSKYLCSNKCGQTLSQQRKKRGLTVCARCQTFQDNRQRVEHEWLEKIESWGYHPSVHDRVVKSSDCSVINRRRADYMFLTEDSFPYHIVVECDENNHSGTAVACEMGRLEEIHDQLIGNTAAVKPIAVVRFNPLARTDPGDELKDALDFLFKGTYIVNDIRGVNLYKVIGYSRTRLRVYEESKFTTQITHYI